MTICILLWELPELPSLYPSLALPIQLFLKTPKDSILLIILPFHRPLSFVTLVGLRWFSFPIFLHICPPSTLQRTGFPTFIRILQCNSAQSIKTYWRSKEGFESAFFHLADIFRARCHPDDDLPIHLPPSPHLPFFPSMHASIHPSSSYQS